MDTFPVRRILLFFLFLDTVYWRDFAVSGGFKNLQIHMIIVSTLIVSLYLFYILLCSCREYVLLFIWSFIWQSRGCQVVLVEMFVDPKLQIKVQTFPLRLKWLTHKKLWLKSWILLVPIIFIYFQHLKQCDQLRNITFLFANQMSLQLLHFW